ncbi:hypothetical protein MKW94_002922 [Papaver nudicaule]|uniref:Phospholipid/glycerol acyltransferase domain-containing protein n=1 Tax=Papaver nudicaule TaxID=74823 RepID=A0AA41S4X4_PAPNU|nr:hypothetical protein [Papaver nudicaule]
METELKDITNLKNNNKSQSEEEGKEKDNQPLLQKSEGDSTEISYTEKDIQELEKKFAAYVRNDVYGTMGLGEISLKEKILLGLAMITLLPIRLIVTVAILTFYYFVCRLCTLFSVPNREEGEDGQEDYAHLIGWRRNVIVAFGRFCSRAILFTNGFYWINETRRAVEKSPNEDQSKEPSEESERPGAIISNHVSYLDILYHMSSSFPSFVAKRSVAKLPLVGLISKCLGCVYVQRESKSAEFKGVAGVVTDRIVEAHQNEHAPLMLLFPEGTTTNGDFLLPFKTGAFIAKAPVLPVILRYPYQRFSPAWDTISGVRHIVLLLCQFVNHIEVIRLPVYHPSEQEKEDPRLYADNVRKLLATEGKLTLTDIGLPEKRVYHAALNGFLRQR